jgi:hypothetical protein
VKALLGGVEVWAQHHDARHANVVEAMALSNEAVRLWKRVSHGSRREEEWREGGGGGKGEGRKRGVAHVEEVATLGEALKASVQAIGTEQHVPQPAHMFLDEANGSRTPLEAGLDGQLLARVRDLVRHQIELEKMN